MVQEYQSPVRVYKHPFELIMAVSKSYLMQCCVCFICFNIVFTNKQHDQLHTETATPDGFILTQKDES
uniref:C2H2-type domain-containing protein n=1 Tax=Labrus bergylta TaxID=56723 RepID=A0A3Q3F9U0_9LABR